MERGGQVPTVGVVGYLSLDEIRVDGVGREDVPGGAALYAALGALAGGVRVLLGAARGSDFPEAILEALAARGVDLSAVDRRDHPTRRARLVYGRAGRRDSGHYRQGEWHVATRALTPPLLPDAATPAVVVLTAMPAAALERQIAWARARRAGVVVDTSEVFATGEGERLLELIGRVDLFAPSREETRRLLPGLDDDAALKALGGSLPARRPEAGRGRARAGLDRPSLGPQTAGPRRVRGGPDRGRRRLRRRARRRGGTRARRSGAPRRRARGRGARRRRIRARGARARDAGAGGRAVTGRHVQLQGIRKAFGALPVLRDCDLEVEKGEVMTLLGPSGCGKTTLLRTIAGFVVPDAGSVSIGGRDVTFRPPNRRAVGMVFQHYALFPHMTVFGNVGYGLRVRRLGRGEIERRVRAALQLVELAQLAERWPGQLSGGQQQRVALARVLVLAPEVLLLDEPFGALDAKLRQAMQVDLRQLVRRLGITTVFVTHDQDEALTLSDRIAVMRAGVIEQVGTPLEIYDRPATTYVADFVGQSNLLAGEAQAGRIELGPGVALPAERTGRVTVVIRPEHLAVRRDAAGPGWVGTLTFVKHAGATTEYQVEVGRPAPLRVLAMRDPGGDLLVVGDRVRVELRDSAACVVLGDGAWP